MEGDGIGVCGGVVDGKTVSLLFLSSGEALAKKGRRGEEAARESRN